MKYTYKNLKHVKLHGMKPGETKEFNHPILGGGIELVGQSEEKKKGKEKLIQQKNKEMIKQ